MQETNNSSRKNLGLADVRAHLSGQDGKGYWRSLDELAQTDAFTKLVQREFYAHYQVVLTLLSLLFLYIKLLKINFSVFLLILV